VAAISSETDQGQGIPTILCRGTSLQTITAPETPGFLVQGKPFTVAYTVFNIGQLAAEDIAIDDAWAEADYVLLSGSPAKTWKSLAP